MNQEFWDGFKEAWDVPLNLLEFGPSSGYMWGAVSVGFTVIAVTLSFAILGAYIEIKYKEGRARRRDEKAKATNQG